MKQNKLAITSLILGIASYSFWELSIIPIMAIIVGSITLIKALREGTSGTLYAIIGISLGILGLLFRIYLGGVHGPLISNTTTSTSKIFQQQITSEINDPVKNPSKNNLVSENNNINNEGSYYVSFFNYGGIDFRKASVTAVSANNTVLDPTIDYVYYYINIPSDHVWVNCEKKNYSAFNVKSLSMNKFTVDPVLGVGMALNMGKNELSFICVPNN